MYKVEKQWKEFNISLDDLEVEMKTLFPESDTDPVYKGNQAHGILELWFDKDIEGYGKDEDGNITVEPGSHAETIENLWNAIDENHAIATNYISQADFEAVLKEEREAAASANIASLSNEQKRMMFGLDLDITHKRNIHSRRRP